jgi:hypothetical protein
MYQLIRRKIEEIKPELAEFYLTKNTYDGQRPLREKRVKLLCDIIENGLFTTGNIAIGKQGWNGGEHMMANGQHMCTATIITGKPVQATVEEYYCKTPEDFALLYRQFDNHGARTLQEVTLPEARALGLNWSKQAIKAIMSGIGLLENHLGVHKNIRVESLKKYVDDGNFINDILSCVKSNESKHLRRRVVIAAMISTFRKNHNDAEIFWEEVRDGENLKGNSPSLKLRNYLMTTNTAIGQGVNAPSLSVAASEKEIYAKCIIAWNAYRRGDSTALKFYANKETPKPV